MSQYKRLRTSDLEKPLKKKKDHKEDYQHQYVDAYADNKILGRVNDDCWAEIFMYLSPFERPKVAWVCKKWKQVLAYSWIDVKKLELTQWNYDNELMRPSYMKKYPTEDESLLGQEPLFRFLKSLLGNCGSHLSELDVTVYGHCNILQVISKSCQNLVKLKLKLNNMFIDINEDTFADLSKLKVLKIIFEYHNPIRTSIILITLLRNVARTLTELSLSYWVDGIADTRLSLTRLSHVIQELKALKTIEFFGFNIDNDDLSMYLKNSQILVFNHHEGLLTNPRCSADRIAISLKSYGHVTSLFLLYNVTNDLLYNIANCMEQIRILSALCERVTDPGIIAISKMNNLIFLDLKGHSDVTESSIILLKNFKTLRLPYSNKITDCSVTKILENSPNIEEFHIRGSAITSKFIKKAAEISRNRQIKLKLRIQPTMPAGIEQYESPYLNIFPSKRKKIFPW